MSTTLQTIEPDEPTVTANSQSQTPTRNAEPSRPASGAIAGQASPGDTEAGTVVTLVPSRLDRPTVDAL